VNLGGKGVEGAVIGWRTDLTDQSSTLLLFNKSDLGVVGLILKNFYENYNPP
jgi:hypothetical protein